MSWEVCYLDDQAIILVTNRGRLTYQDFSDEINAIVLLSEKHHLFKILVDDTEMSSGIGTIDIFSFPKLYEDAGMSKRCKIAILISEDEDQVGDFHFFETVCLNRGYNTKVFFNVNNAKAWLA
jgi:hypothetical protein